MKRPAAILIGSTMMVILFFIGLNYKTNPLNQQKNGFTRKFMKDPIEKSHTHFTKGTFRDICGSTADHIYFSDDIPGRITATNLDLSVIDTFYLNIMEQKNIVPVFYTFIDSPHIYILASKLQSILRGDINTGRYASYEIRTGSFSNGIVADSQCIVMRCLNKSIPGALFKKVDMINGTVKIENGLTENRRDAGFAFDGNLCFDPITRKFVYVCAYCNNVTCFDTSLTRIFKSRTIDTCNTPKVQILVTETSITHAAPPILINKICAAYKGKFFVQSTLKADNESGDFSDNSVIDIYDQNDGSYMGSFYLPTDQSDKLKKIKMTNDHLLVAIYENKIMTYILNI